MAGNFVKTADELGRQVLKWSVTASEVLQPCFKSETPSSMPKLMNIYGSVVHDGIALAKRLSGACKRLLGSHVAMSRPLNRTLLEQLAPLLEALQSMSELFHAKESVLAECMAFQQRLMARTALTCLTKISQVVPRLTHSPTHPLHHSSTPPLHHSTIPCPATCACRPQWGLP